MGKKEVNLTGGKLHRALRDAAAEMTPDYSKRQERRAKFDKDFGNCEHGNPPAKCCRR